MLMIFMHFIDAFLTYLCADVFCCFSVIMDLLSNLKWDTLTLLGIDRLKTHISIQIIATIITHLRLIFTGSGTGTITVNITLKL